MLDNASAASSVARRNLPFSRGCTRGGSRAVGGGLASGLAASRRALATKQETDAGRAGRLPGVRPLPRQIARRSRMSKATGGDGAGAAVPAACAGLPGGGRYPIHRPGRPGRSDFGPYDEICAARIGPSALQRERWFGPRRVEAQFA